MEESMLGLCKIFYIVVVAMSPCMHESIDLAHFNKDHSVYAPSQW